MSALGQKRTFSEVYAMSALPPKADMDQRGSDVRFEQLADNSLGLADVRFIPQSGR
jgi:hypothetical protein